MFCFSLILKNVRVFKSLTSEFFVNIVQMTGLLFLHKNFVHAAVIKKINILCLKKKLKNSEFTTAILCLNTIILFKFDWKFFTNEGWNESYIIFCVFCKSVVISGWKLFTNFFCTVRNCIEVHHNKKAFLFVWIFLFIILRFQFVFKYVKNICSHADYNKKNFLRSKFKVRILPNVITSIF